MTPRPSLCVRGSVDNLSACLKRESAAVRDLRRRLADAEGLLKREKAAMMEAHTIELAAASQARARMLHACWRTQYEAQCTHSIQNCILRTQQRTGREV